MLYVSDSSQVTIGNLIEFRRSDVVLLVSYMAGQLWYRGLLRVLRAGPFWVRSGQRSAVDYHCPCWAVGA